MKMQDGFSRRRIECACKSHYHTLALDISDEEGFPRTVDIYLSTSSDRYSFWNRVKTAWSILRGNDSHILDGFMLEEGDNLEEFVSAACSLLHNSGTGFAAYLQTAGEG